MTAEQAAEAAKGLTFEKVWEAMNRTDERIEKARKETDERIEKANKELREQIAELSKNVGGVNNSLGRFTESLFSEGLDDLFTAFGYTFKSQGPHYKFKGNGKTIAEADYFLEDGEYAMVVEVKTELKAADVDEHIERLETIRQHFDARGDKRILIGAVAGGIVNKSVLSYAQGKGLYVITQRGDNAVVADMPRGFKPREW